MATTKQGKAIAARNATKHGVFSQKPPTIDDQDHGLFEETKAALLTEFEPQTITEEIQIEQIVMARVRLHRLWRCEAAGIQSQRLKAQRRALDTSDSFIGDSLSISALFGTEPKIPPALQEEIGKLERMLADLEPEEKSIIYSDKYQQRLQREERHLQRTIEGGVKYLQEQRDHRNGVSPKTLEAIALN